MISSFSVKTCGKSGNAVSTKSAAAATDYHHTTNRNFVVIQRDLSLVSTQNVKPSTPTTKVWTSAIASFM